MGRRWERGAAQTEGDGVPADSGQSGSYHSESTRCALFRLFRAFRGKPDDAASGATGKMDGVDCAVGPALTFPFHGFAGI